MYIRPSENRISHNLSPLTADKGRLKHFNQEKQ